MRIVIVSTLQPPEHGGGIATYGRNLAESLAAQGHQVRILCYTREQERVEVVNGVALHRFRHRQLPFLERFLPGLAWSIFIWSKLKDWQQSDPFDVVEFSNWEGAGLVTTMVSHNFPVITRLVTPYFESLNISSTSELKWGDRFVCWMEKKTVKNSSVLITSTHHHARMMAESYQLDSAAITVVPLGIRLGERPAPAPVPVDEKEINILYVSRLEHRKGTLTLLEAIPKVLKELPKVRFTFIGPDRPHAPGKRPFKDYFQQTYPEFSAKVDFLGYQPDEAVEAAYANCDLFVVPSKYESFGLIYVEAMACGKPVIGCACGGIPEVIKHPETGLVLPPDNPKALARNILVLCQDAELRSRMGMAARRWVEEKFDRERMAANTLQAYQTALNN